MKEYNALSRLMIWLNKLIIGFANISLIAITLLVTAEVFSRKLFNVSFVFVTALTSIFFPWLVFLAIILITQANEHIAVNYFFNKLAEKQKKYIALFNRLVMLTFSVFMLISSYKLTIDVVNINIPVLNISRSWLYSSMLVAFFVTSIILLLQCITIIRDGKIGGNENNMDYDL